MRLRTYFLAAAALVVVIGGIYLWLDVRGTSASESSLSPEAVAAAKARHAQEGGASDGDGALRRLGRGVDGEGSGAGEARRIGGLPRPRPNLPMQDPAIFDRPPHELADRLRVPGAMQPPPGAVDPDDPDAASAMTESNKMYDRGDYDGARSLAMKLLGKDPANVRMLRVVVSSSCILGDADVATQYWSKLPPADQQQMAIRCSRYQVNFPGAGLPATDK